MVCDCTELKTVEDISVIIEKLTQIEKTNNLFYDKCILLNKTDKFISDKTQTAAIINELNKIKSKYRIKYYKISALTGKGVVSSIREYLNQIFQKENESKNEGFGDDDNNEDEEDENTINCTDQFNFYSRKIFCGSTMFTCGVYKFNLDETRGLRR